MPFIIYKRAQKLGKTILHRTDEPFKLAGHHLIQAAWELNNKPLDIGWDVSANALIGLQTEGTESSATRALLIDLKPKSTREIRIFELLHVYAYTESDNGKPEWTILMMRMRDILHLYERNGKRTDAKNQFTDTEKKPILAEILEPSEQRECVEFLYLGEGESWKWGRNGSTNAAIIGGRAREYFQKYF